MKVYENLRGSGFESPAVNLEDADFSV
jgi:hypothetical protein